MKRFQGRRGFTLIELLTVIAIIAILAAILFPVMGMVKNKAKTTACITNLKTIYVGLQQYRTDNGRYPEYLLGLYTTPSMDSCKDKSLYPEYVRSLEDFTCPSAASGDPVSKVDVSILGVGVSYYYGDSYDWVDYQGAGRSASYEWMWARPAADGMPSTADVVVYAEDPEKPNSPDIDYRRQLRFKDPDATTVITWCMNHNSGAKAQVLFLSGNVVPVTGEDMTPSTLPNGKMVQYREVP